MADADATFDPLRDRIVRGGPVRTMDPRRPRAEAVALRGGRVLAVGSEAEVRAAASDDAEVLDLGGACLLPGFHDAHVHLTLHGFEMTRLQLGSAGSPDEVAARVRAEAARVGPGTWVQGAGFALERLGVDRLDRDVLDAAAPDNPVFLRSQDHHSAWVNGAALERARLGADTPDPPGGRMPRRADGSPTGHLLERAVDAVAAALPEPGAFELREVLDAAGRDLASMGVTTVHHMAFEPPSYWRGLASAASDEAFPVRVWACVGHEHIEAAQAVGLATGQGGERFTVGGAKFFVDGALGSLTAWMLEPYDGGDDRGVVLDGPDVLRERIPRAIAAGLTPVAHAIGDAAGRALLDVLEAEAPNWRAAGLLPRVEHAQHLHPDDVRRLGRMGLVASMQPLHLTFDAPTIHTRLRERETRAYPVRALLEAGATVAFGSDTPVAPPGVLPGLRAAVERGGIDGRTVAPEHAVDVEAALAAHTRGPAAAIGRAGRSGVLRRGAHADLVALSHDPADAAAGGVHDLEVVLTAVGGRVVYTA